MVSIVQGQLAATLHECCADLKASLVDILCSEAKGSNCSYLPLGSRKFALQTLQVYMFAVCKMKTV
jgi:hypothetical protein